MENEKNTLTEELKGMLDLTPENVERVFLYATADKNGKRILCKDSSKYDALIHEVNACAKPDSRFSTVYFNEFNLVNTRFAVGCFLRQLRISFLNKGLNPDNEKYIKCIPSDYARLKICDGTNVIKMNDGTGSMKFATVWVGNDQPETLNQLLTLAIGNNLMDPLKVTNRIGKDGKPILGIDTTKGAFPGLIPLMREEKKKALEALVIKQLY